MMNDGLEFVAKKPHYMIENLQYGSAKPHHVSSLKSFTIKFNQGFKCTTE